MIAFRLAVIALAIAGAGCTAPPAEPQRDLLIEYNDCLNGYSNTVVTECDKAFPALAPPADLLTQYNDCLLVAKREPVRLGTDNDGNLIELPNPLITECDEKFPALAPR